MLGQPVLHEVLAAAVLNHPDFVAATPDYPNDGDITIHARDGQRYLGVIGIATDEDTALVKPPAPATAPSEDADVDDILRTVGQLRSRTDDNPDRVVFDAAADLLEHIAGTWDQQDDPTRQRAVALARTLRAGVSPAGSDASDSGLSMGSQDAQGKDQRPGLSRFGRLRRSRARGGFVASD